MKLQKLSIILLALLLAAMAMIPMVSAGEIIPSEKVIGMKYFQDNQANEMKKRIDAPDASSILAKTSEYALVTVDPKAFMQDADGKHQVTITLDGIEYQMEIHQIASPIDKNAKLIIGDSKSEKIVDLPRILSYRGVIINGETGDALFTVCEDVILGKINVGNSSYIIDQLGPGLRDDGKVVHILYNSDKVITDPKSQKAHDAEIYENLIEEQKGLSDSASESGILAGIKSTSTVDLLAVYDPSFSSLFSNPNGEISNMILQVNTAFSPTGTTIAIKEYRLATDLSSMDADDLLPEFRSKYSTLRDSTGSDLAFFFTGRDMVDADGIGYVYNGNARSGWALAQMVSKSNYSGSFSQRNILIAHELGHNFGATHAQSTTWQEWLILTRYTIMNDPWEGDNMRLEYSSPSGHGDATHNNAGIITTNKGTIASYR